MTPDKAVDIAVLPLSDQRNTQLCTFEPGAAPCGVPALDIGSQLFVIGYPNGQFGSANTALWTNVTIGSSLTFPFLPNRPTFAVNGSTRSGQSGSPVVRFSGAEGMWVTTNQSLIADGRPRFFFAGIYSGQIDGRSSEMGIVWRPELINEVLREGVIPRGRDLDASEL